MDFMGQEIEQLLQILLFQKKNYTRWLKNSPPGGLLHTMKKKHSVFMHAIPDGTYPSGQRKYRRTILTDHSELLGQLALKEYLRIALSTLDRNIRILEYAKAGLLPMGFEAIRSKMRKPYLFLPDHLLADSFPGTAHMQIQKQWAEQPFAQSNFRPQDKTHFTSRGLAVRSRAEALIAEMLYKYEIPFRYEQVLVIGRYEMAPDFTFLDADGREFYWEYCGGMDDPDYIDHQLWRRKLYEGAGITEWDNMIYTYGCGGSIDMREIEAIIKTKVLPRMQLIG